MLEKITYKNHMNEVIDFGSGSIFVNESDLHDFAWSVSSKNGRISAFTKGIVPHTIPVVIVCDSEEEGLKIRNSLFEKCEKDVLAMKHGKIIIGDYYLKCFVTESKKTEYLKNTRTMKLSLKVTTDFPFWIKETTTTFNYGAGSEGTNLDFNRDFPSDYTSNLIGKDLVNTDFVASNFRINIYGACESPSVTIAGHEYSVNASVGTNEYLTIDSIEKTIVLTHSDGTKENCFNRRNRDSYIFEKIPSGVSTVANNGAFKFDVILLEERGEPKWI